MSTSQIENIDLDEIKLSLRALHLEKLLIISKEMEFIHNILNFFEGYQDKSDSLDKDPKKNNIKRLKKDIENLSIRIKRIKDRLIFQEMKNRNNLEFIIFYDYVKIQIEEMLKIINALYVKMNQLFGEMLNQYIPYPTFFGRRYSSNGLLMYLDNFFNKIYLGLRENNKQERKLVLMWGHTTNFNYKILRNRDIKRENYKKDTHNDYIELPYWYYELPFLIPAITHEIVLLALNKEGTTLFSYYEKLYSALEKFYSDRSNLLIQEIGDILGYKNIIEELSKDIFSDIVSYKIHGVSYFFTMFYNLFGEKTARDFIKVIYDKKDGRTIKDYKIVANDWFFVPKKDHNFLRLYLLASIILKEKFNEEVKAIYEFLKVIMNLDDEENRPDSFEEYYLRFFPNYYSTYISVKSYIKLVYLYLKKFFIQNPDFLKNIELLIENDVNLKGYFKDFDHVWQKRREKLDEKEKDIKVIAKGYFRKLVHEEVSEIYLEDVTTVLRFIKKRKDFNLNPDDKNFSAITEEILCKNEKNKENSFCSLGLYDEIVLTKKEETLSLNKEIDQCLNNIDNDQNSKKNNNKDIENPHSKNTNFKIRFFENKHLLLKILDKSNNEKEQNSPQNDKQVSLQNNTNDSEKFILITNIELKKNQNNPNGYEDLKNSIEDIKECFEKRDITEYVLYKSLGPKDLTLIVKDQKIDKLFSILNFLNSLSDPTLCGKNSDNIKTDQEKTDKKENLINRTFSFICIANNKEKNNLELDDKYRFVTYVRVPNKNMTQFKEKLKSIKKFSNNSNDDMIEVYEITGMMDYKIVWKNIKNINNLFEYYKKFVEFTSDYQTKIEKKVL